MQLCSRASDEKFPGGANTKKTENRKTTWNSTIKPLPGGPNEKKHRKIALLSLPFADAHDCATVTDLLMVVTKYNYYLECYSKFTYLVQNNEQILDVFRKNFSWNTSIGQIHNFCNKSVERFSSFHLRQLQMCIKMVYLAQVEFFH